MEDTKPNTDDNAERLVRQLRNAGLSPAAIDAAWPTWWSDELASEPSGRAELRFALARRLGISPKSLSGERVEFIWTGQAKFKNGPPPGTDAGSVLTSFGISIARSLTAAAPPLADLEGQTALDLRRLIMQDRPMVDLEGILSFCWAVGIPVVHLRVFPLQSQSMHAMAVAVGVRPAVFLARNSSYPAPTAFTLAHELGHIVLGHVAPSSALVELEDPASAATSDDQELAANRFALSLLTAHEQPRNREERRQIQRTLASRCGKESFESVRHRARHFGGSSTPMTPAPGLKPCPRSSSYTPTRGPSGTTSTPSPSTKSTGTQ